MDSFERTEAFHVFESCVRCKGKNEKRLFGRGSGKNEMMLVFPAVRTINEKPSLMSVGEERLLSNLLLLFDLKLPEFYYTSLVKCADLPRSGKEAKNCIDFLRAQYISMKPGLILCFGKEASKALISSEFKLDAEHGKKIKKGKTIFCGTFSLSDALRDPGVKRKMLSDFTGIFGQIGESFE